MIFIYLFTAIGFPYSVAVFGKLVKNEEVAIYKRRNNT
jgi:hypothetical protein